MKMKTRSWGQIQAPSVWKNVNKDYVPKGVFKFVALQLCVPNSYFFLTPCL